MRDIDADLAGFSQRDIDADLADFGKRDIEADLGEINDSWFADVRDFIFSGPDGTPNTGILRPKQWLESGPSYEESKKRVVGGAISGLTLGAVEPWKNEVGGTAGYQAGELVGTLAPMGAISKGTGLLPFISKLPGAIKLGVRGALTGTGIGTARETVSAAKGNEFDIQSVGEDAAVFGLLDATLGVLGATGRKLLKMRDSRKFAGEVRTAIAEGRMKPIADEQIGAMGKLVEGGSTTEKALYDDAVIVNARSAPSPNVVGAPHVNLQHPAVTRGQLKTMMNIKEQPASVGKTKFQTTWGIENPIRTHQRLGTKEIMYNGMRAADNAAAVESARISKEFNTMRKSLFPLGSRGKASERIMIHATAKQPGGTKVLEEMGITEVPVLTEAETKMYDYMRGHLKNYYAEINKARMASGIAPFREVPDYFTFWRSVEGELQGGHSLLTMGDDVAAKRWIKPKKTPFRFEKGRVLDNYGELKLDAFSVFERYVGAASKHKHLTPEIAKCRQLLEGKFYNGFKLQESNPGAYHVLDGWLKSVSGVPHPIDMGLGPVAPALRKVNENLAASVLAYNARSAGIQWTAIVNTVTAIGPKYTGSGVGKLFDPKMRKFAMENSEHLGGRNFDVFVTDMMNSISGQMSGVKKKAAKVGIAPLQILDMETAKASWLGAYTKATEKLGMGHKEAVTFADDVVVSSQASGSAVDLAPIQRHALGKFGTIFQTFVINNWGFLTRDVLGIGNPKITNREAMKKVLTYITGVMAVNVLYEDVLQTRSPFPAPIHEFVRRRNKGDDATSQLFGAMKEMTEVVPILGGPVRYSGSPFGAGAQLGSDVVDVLGGDATTKKTLETAGKAIGFPGTVQIRKTIRDLEKLEK